jgi:hypothetical protein
MNEFSIESFTQTVLDTIKEKWPLLLGPAGIAIDGISTAKGRIVGDIANAELLAALILRALEKGAEFLIPILQAIIIAIGKLMGPGMTVLGELTKTYADHFAKSQAVIKPGSLDSPHPQLQPVAAGMFDSILAPVAHLTTGANPAQVGAGEVNSKYILGSIISLHLSTWMVNIISNLTGLGALKFINSFDDVILAALSTRSLSRAAFKGYITKFVGDPLERDLNLKLPLDSFGPSTLVKTFLRGGLTRDQLVQKMRGKGYAENITEQLLLDTAKMLPLDAVAYLVNNAAWTERQGLEHLEQQGYPNELAPTVLYLSRNDLIFSQYRSLANSLVSARGDRQFSNELLREMLADLGFTPNEVNAFALRGAMLAELPKRLSLAQVKELFKESLVDLNYVHLFLKDEGYSDDDADLLELLEFVKKEERDARRAAQAEAKRHREEAAAELEAAREAKRQATLLRLAS